MILAWSTDRFCTFKRGGGYCWLRCCRLELLDRELLVYVQQEDKLEQLELRNLSLMRVSNRILPLPDIASEQTIVIFIDQTFLEPRSGFSLTQFLPQVFRSVFSPGYVQQYQDRSTHTQHDE